MIGVCRLHGKEADAYSGSIIPFNSNSLKKSQSILKPRQIQNLNYSDVKLQMSVDSAMGYHITNYRRFIALLKVQRGKMEEAKKLEGQSCKNNIQNSERIVPTRVMRPTVKFPKQSQSTGVFPKICLFCNLAKTRIKGKDKSCQVLNRRILRKI